MIFESFGYLFSWRIKLWDEWPHFYRLTINSKLRKIRNNGYLTLRRKFQQIFNHSGTKFVERYTNSSAFCLSSQCNLKKVSSSPRRYHVYNIMRLVYTIFTNLYFLPINGVEFRSYWNNLRYAWRWGKGLLYLYFKCG